jgi:hypothetical protein
MQAAEQLAEHFAEHAEQFATPRYAELGELFEKTNDLGQPFMLRWGKITFDVALDASANIKVLLQVYRDQGIRESYIVDTDPFDVGFGCHKRNTRDFYILPDSSHFGPVRCVKFAFIAHLDERSIPSQFEYIFMDGHEAMDPARQHRAVSDRWVTTNHFRSYELSADQLQRDVDWYNHHPQSLNLTPKFTKGQPQHPYHPKRYIHDHIDKVIAAKRDNPHRLCTIKVSVDCIDDRDFINHLIHASRRGVFVQCIVDWRKMTLTNSESYAHLKRSGIELIGVFCTPRHPLIELAPDMHTKFIIFNDEDCILGSFNITFDRWWANWESGMTFRSKGVCRLLDNIFQSQRGGFIQRYGIDPMSPFNLLYTYGRHYIKEGKNYRPHHAIFAEIRRARHSLKLSLFLMGELMGDHHDSVADALIEAKNRGVDVQLLLNGHLARVGEIGRERTMEEELNRPLLPTVERLRAAGVRVGLVYGRHDHAVPYSPIHSKYCVIDETIVLEGSFNWYNASVFSHDLLVVIKSRDIAAAYLHEFEQIQRLFRIF